MVRSCVATTRLGPAVGIYVVMVREYMTTYLTCNTDKDVKTAIKAAGGVCNVSGVFLKTTSVVNAKSGINRRSVAFIPRSQVPKDILNQLDKSNAFGSEK